MATRSSESHSLLSGVGNPLPLSPGLHLVAFYDVRRPAALARASWSPRSYWSAYADSFQPRISIPFRLESPFPFTHLSPHHVPRWKVTSSNPPARLSDAARWLVGARPLPGPSSPDPRFLLAQSGKSYPLFHSFQSLSHPLSGYPSLPLPDTLWMSKSHWSTLSPKRASPLPYGNPFTLPLSRTFRRHCVLIGQRQTTPLILVLRPMLLSHSGW
jgi:hypothetical protein